MRGYFHILLDTLLGPFLPACTKRAKRRVIQAPKFYFADVGIVIVNALAKRARLQAGTELFGKAIENWVCHESTAFLSYREMDSELRYWRLASGIEVDFVTDDLRLAVEVKGTARPTDAHLRGLRALREDQRSVQRRVPAAVLLSETCAKCGEWCGEAYAALPPSRRTSRSPDKAMRYLLLS